MRRVALLAVVAAIACSDSPGRASFRVPGTHC
jgi:hypothetical protein